jgi:hypothetical protein
VGVMGTAWAVATVPLATACFHCKDDIEIGK